MPSELTPAPAADVSLVDRLKAARMLDVSPNTIDNLRKRGQLPSVKFGAVRRFDVDDLRRFVSQRKAVAS